MKNKISIIKDKSKREIKLLLNGEVIKGVKNVDINYSYDAKLLEKTEIVVITFENSSIEVINSE